MTTTEGEVSSDFTPVSSTTNAAPAAATTNNPYGTKYADFLSNVSQSQLLITKMQTMAQLGSALAGEWSGR